MRGSRCGGEKGEDENAPQAREDGWSRPTARTTLGFSFDCEVTWPGRARVGEAVRGRWTGELEPGVPESRCLGGAGKALPKDSLNKPRRTWKSGRMVIQCQPTQVARAADC